MHIRHGSERQRYSSDRGNPHQTSQLVHYTCDGSQFQHYWMKTVHEVLGLSKQSLVANELLSYLRSIGSLLKQKDYSSMVFCLKRCFPYRFRMLRWTDLIVEMHPPMAGRNLRISLCFRTGTSDFSPARDPPGLCPVRVLVAKQLIYHAARTGNT